MAANRHVTNASIIIAGCTALRDGFLVAKKNGFLDLEIEGDSKVIIDRYNKKIIYLVQLFY